MEWNAFFTTVVDLDQQECPVSTSSTAIKTGLLSTRPNNPATIEYAPASKQSEGMGGPISSQPMEREERNEDVCLPSMFWAESIAIKDERHLGEIPSKQYPWRPRGCSYCDSWYCLECCSMNLMTLSPERCSICGHDNKDKETDPCDDCHEWQDAKAKTGLKINNDTLRTRSIQDQSEQKTEYCEDILWTLTTQGGKCVPKVWLD